MKYDRFEDLPVWKLSAGLAVEVIGLTDHAWFRRKGDLVSQLRRAMLSVSNNIAEGFERGSTGELLYFLYVARGSAGEVRSMLHVAGRLKPPPPLQQELTALLPRVENASRQLRGWAGSPQDSDIKGQRHLTTATRAGWERQKREHHFLDHIRANVEHAARQREAERRQQQPSAKDATDASRKSDGEAANC